MRFRIDAKDLVKAVEICDLNEASKIILDKDGMTILAIDNSHTAMAVYHHPSSAFAEYVPEDEPIEFGLDLWKLADILKLYDGEVDVIIDENLTINQDDFANSIAVLPSSSVEIPKIPNLNFDVKAIVDASKFAQFIKAALKTSDYFTMEYDGSQMVLSANGEDLDVCLNLEVEDGNDKTATARYPLFFIERVIKRKRDGLIEFNFSTDYPLKLVFDIGGGTIEYLVAPRIEE